MHRAIRAAVVGAALLVATAAVAEVGPTARDLQRASRLTRKGDQALKAGNLARAMESYQQALQIVPDLPEGHVGMGHVLMRRHEFQGALDAFSHAVDCYGNMGKELFRLRAERHGDAQIGADRVRMRIGALESSVERLQSSLTALSASSSPSAARDAQQIKLRLRAERAALNSQRMELQRLERIEAPRADEIHRAPGEIYFFIGNALLNLERTDEAVRAWETCARMSPDFPLVYNNLAVGYWKLDRLDDALRCVGQAEERGFQVNPAFKADLHHSLSGRPSGLVTNAD